MLTLLAEQLECLWDDALPIEVKELPEDLAALDVLLSDPELLWPLVERWRQESPGDRAAGADRGQAHDSTGDVCAVDGARAALPRWGYRSLVAEVSDSIRLRRPAGSRCRSGCRTVDGPQSSPGGSAPRTVSELTRAMIVKACRESAVSAAGGT